MLIENVNIATPSNKKYVVGSDLDRLEILGHQDIRISNGKIEDISPSSSEDCATRWVIPAFCDSHTHAVFCGMRENEIDLRKTIGYEEVLKRGGGIYSTVRSTSECSEESLYLESKKRIVSMMNNGTAVLECKTGYGTTMEDEDKSLRVMEKIEKDLRVTIKKTLLAHVTPKGRDEKTYLKEFKEMIEDFRNRIDYVDVFLDEGAFSPSFAREAFLYANSVGIPGRVHMNELRNLGGLKALEGLNIHSYDHMIETREDEIDSIDNTITMLPFTAMSLGKDVRIFSKMRDSGKKLAIASDISPNTYVTSLLLVISLARQMFPFTIENLINMSTLNSCHSLGISDGTGSVHRGKEANLIVLKESYNEIGYKFGEDPIERVIINGKDVRKQLRN